MNLISVANETISITKAGKYTVNGQEVMLPEDTLQVEVISPESGAELLSRDMEGLTQGEMCRIEVTGEDSFQAASRFSRAFVMNYANAHNPGGGFRLGAKAQEEALCRCSTLYGSITSDKAAEMYRYNNTHLSAVESDYMLLSPNVAVFRSSDCELLETPFAAAVITAPAPNRRGAAFLSSKKTIQETFLRRIRIILRTAAVHGYKDLVLGAWGCGAFGNDPAVVAECFRTALFDDGLGRAFDTAVFAVCGDQEGRNPRAFREVFGK